jgi:hypothetical protein
MSTPITQPNLFKNLRDLENRISALERRKIDGIFTDLPTIGNYDGRTIIFEIDSTTYWQLTYSSQTGDAYPWVCVGGVPLWDEVLTSEATASTTYAALATAGPDFTTPLAGIYEILVGAQCSTAAVSGNTAFVSYDVGGTAANDQWAAYASAAAAVSVSVTPARKERHTISSASQLIICKYRSSATASGTVTFVRRWLHGMPIRVG